MLGRMISIVVVHIVASCSLAAAAGNHEGLWGEAATAIQNEILSSGINEPDSVHVFYGDLTGTGTKDAISLIYHPSGGNSNLLTTWVWKDTGNGYVLARTVPINELSGVDPRDVIFSPGGISISMTVPKPDDPRCCPTGEHTFTLQVNVSGRLVSSAQSGRNWIVTVETNPTKASATGTAMDGKTKFDGGCNPLLGPGFVGSLYGYAGEALQRVDDESEVVTFDVGARNGTVTFAGRMHYFAPDEAWVTTDALPVAFLEAFARGDNLTIRNGRGEEVVAFELSGSSKAVQTMRPVCGM